jgi:hypothetical protein
MLIRHEFGVNNVGKCEHCNILLSTQIMLNLTGELHCPTCGKAITSKSLGYDMEGGSVSRKVKWIDENGEWTTIKPKVDYIIRSTGWKVKIINSSFYKR